MAVIILCESCKQQKPHHGRNLCASCYQRLFRQTQISYFQSYRSRPEYPEQRRQYDIRYTLKTIKKTSSEN